LSSLDDSGAIFHYHREMIAVHGSDSSLALGWREAADQQARFGVLAGMANLDGCTVLDAGCGYADLLPCLSARYQISHYCGIELIPELLDEASKRYGHLTYTAFISGNFLSRQLPAADYVLASGSLNYGSSDPAFIYKAISKLFGACTCGLVFNLLKTVPKNGCLVAYEPDDILAYCRTLSGKIVFKADYAEEDFTVLIQR